MSEQISVELHLPFPPLELNPNRSRRLHWAVRHKHAAAYRKDCGWVAKEAMAKHPGPFPLAPKVEADVLFVVADRRRRDVDNLLASLKPGFDGCVDAGLLKDDRAGMLKVASVDLAHRPGQWGVLVTLRAGSGPVQMGLSLG